MEVAEMANFNLGAYRPPHSFAFIGRDQGANARVTLGLDQLDETAEVIELVIPKDTTSFNPSFFLGLLYNSIAKLGIPDFRKKYIFIYETENKQLKDVLLRNIEDGIRNASNSLNNRSGLSVFQ